MNEREQTTERDGAVAVDFEFVMPKIAIIRQALRLPQEHGRNEHGFH